MSFSPLSWFFFSVFADLVLSVGSCTCPPAVTHTVDWSYRFMDGPSLWCSLQKECCGERQSPIHVESSMVLPRPELEPLNLSSYSDGGAVMSMSVTNNGHTVEFRPLDKTVTLSGARCGDEEGSDAMYQLEAFHFHWSRLDAEGSEHAVDNRKYAMEMHLLHRNVAYPTLDEAKAHGEGFKVVAVFIEVRSNLSVSWAPFETLANALPNVRFAGQQHQIGFEWPLHVLFPPPRSQSPEYGYFCYAGSLTTPSCNQAVTWILMKDPVVVAPGFSESFRQLYESKDSSVLLSENVRPVQPINGRAIYTNVAPATS